MKREEIIFKIHELIDEKKDEEILSILKDDEKLLNSYKSLKILLNDLKEIKTKKIPFTLDKKIVKLIKAKKIKKFVSITLSFSLSLILIIVLFSPFINKRLDTTISLKNKGNFKYTVANYITINNISNAEITIYIKDDKIEEKSGNLKIPKEEFNYLIDTLNEKGEVVINKIEGSGEKNDYINIKINYKNYNEYSLINLLAKIVPYLIVAFILIMPLFFILKGKKWRYLKI